MEICLLEKWDLRVSFSRMPMWFSWTWKVGGSERLVLSLLLVWSWVRIVICLLYREREGERVPGRELRLQPYLCLDC